VTAYTYPHLDAAVETGRDPVVERMESTRDQLERAFRNSTGREKERARAALLAYQRALDLYRRLIDLSNMRGGTAISQ
jgi:hypothetical protein